MKSLVVYYSRSGNSKFLAQKIAEKLGADTEEVIDKKNRRGWIGFLTAGRDATRGKETQIEETKFLPNNYDLIVVGTPIWTGRPTPAIRTYLSKNDISKKKVALFCTLNGSNEDKAMANIKALLPNSNIVGTLAIKKVLKNPQEAENKVSAWCSSLTST
jgi:flavodoxin